MYCIVPVCELDPKACPGPGTLDAPMSIGDVDSERCRRQRLVVEIDRDLAVGAEVAGSVEA
jgi:hypothetical protein